MADWKKIFDDAVTQVGEAAAVAGEGLRQAADEAGKVVGIGVGSIELRPDGGTSYRLGEWITGMVALELSEPVAAERLTVTLRAMRKRRVMVQDRHRGGRRSTMRDEVIYEFVSEVGGEQTYQSGESYFSVEIPPEIESKVDVGGLLGDALRAARAVKSMTEQPLRWRLIATLEIPWKRNLSKGIDLGVREESVGVTPEPPRRDSTRRGAAGGDAGQDEEARWEELEREAAKREAAQREAAQRETAKREAAQREAAKREAAKREAAKREAADADQSPSRPGKTTERASREPVTIPEPVSLPGGWGAALARLMGQMPSQGWETIHQWAAPPVDPAVVRDALGRHPDLDPEILLFYSMMDGLELIFGKPAAPRHEYETIVQVRRAASKDGGRLGCIDELWSHSTIGAPYVEEFSQERGGEVRMLEIPSLERLLDQSEDFAHRDGRNVIFGRIVLENGEYFGIVRADEIRRWRQPSAGQRGREVYYDGFASAYQQCLTERERTRPGPWWVVRGQDHGVLWEPALLLRWSEMLAMCLRHLETGSA